MQHTLKISLALLMFVLMLVTACATTQLTSVWKDPDYQKRPVRFMIISVDNNPVTRRFFEDEFAGQIRARGTEAVASYTVLAEDHQEDPAAIAEQVAALGADAVLVTRLMSKNMERGKAPKTLYNPVPYSPKWQDYYGHDNRSIYPPGIIAGEGVVDMETRMYEAVDVRMVWSVSSETEIGGSYQQHIKAYTGSIVKAMAGHGLLGR